jgi:3-oxoacyl-[acyl-carrier-protein] synthase-3
VLPFLSRAPLAVLGIGAVVPGLPVSTEQLLSTVDRQFGLSLGRRGAVAGRWLGIRQRHICRDLRERGETPRAGDSNADLAARAVQVALNASGLTVADLRYLIAHTATPGRAIPPGAAAVADQLGYDGPFVELRQACTGFANALVFAQGALLGDGAGPVAIVGSETGSVFFDPHRAAEDDAQLINLLQMGDGAGAVVLAAPTESQRAIGHIQTHWYGQLAHGRAATFELRYGGSDHLADGNVRPEFEHAFEAIRRDGEQLFRAGIDAAAQLGVRAASSDVIIPHQANGRMAPLLAAALAVPVERVFVNATHFGNTGSAAVWLAFDEAASQLRSGQRVLVLGAEATRFMYGGFSYVHA